MNPGYRPKCDVCGRSAVYHETSIEQNHALETHLCAIHCDERFRSVLRDVHLPHLPSMDMESLLAMAERLRRERGR